MILSVILPTIRLEKLSKFIESFENSYHGEYELICISPYDRPEGIGMLVKNLQWVIDKGDAVRCQQRGLYYAKGEYVTRAVDDSIYEPSSMDSAIKMANSDTVVSLRFIEGNEMEDDRKSVMYYDKFYKLGFHNQTLAPYTPQDCDLINFAIYPTKYLKDMGGWDCNFETIALAETDLSIRINFSGIKIVLTDNIILKCEWIPGDMGDHKPIHEAFSVDMKKYKEKYSNIKCWENMRLKLNNWEQSADVWKRRFNV